MSKRTWRLGVNDGTELHVELSGGGQQALPVLLLNGITMSTDSWNQLGRLLQPERNVIRYDMRGQGASGAPAGPYLRERHALDLLALLEHLAERQLTPLHAVALSNGGYVAQLLLAWTRSPELARQAGASDQELATLAKHRSTIASLTLLDTFATADARLQAVVRSWLSALEYGGAGARFDSAVPWVWGPEFLAANGPALAEVRELAKEQPQHAVKALLEGLLASAANEPDLSEALALPELPLLVAMGEDDVLTPLRNHRHVLELFGRDPNQVHLVPRAGHGAPIENAPAVAALVKPFLRHSDSPPAQEHGGSASGVTAM